jgi:hypothetical protein
MRASPTCCDPARLEKLLADSLGEGEQAGLIAHLDTCAECQRTLETLAAGRRWWDDLRQIEGRESLALHRDGEDANGFGPTPEVAASETLDDQALGRVRWPGAGHALGT